MIKDLQVGQTATLTSMVISAEEGTTKTGSPFLNLTLQDKSGQINCKIWNVKPEYIEVLKPYAVIECKGKVDEFGGKLQLIINEFNVIDDNVDNYIITSHYSIEEMQQYIAAYVGKIKDKAVANVVITLLNEAGTKFYTHAAAKLNHHAFKGGLCQHVIEMLLIADRLIEIWPDLDSDIIYGGIILHDFGKLDELTDDLVAEYTLQGKLFGHIVTGYDRIMDAAYKLGVQDNTRVILMCHAVLAHHGELQYASPVVPKILEADVIHQCDELSAKLNAGYRALEGTNAGEFTEKIFSLENRQLLKWK